MMQTQHHRSQSAWRMMSNDQVSNVIRHAPEGRGGAFATARCRRYDFPTLTVLRMREKRIGILVVAYNAETTLRGVLQRIPPQTIAKIEEVFVFDDASQDRTAEVGHSIAREGFPTQL